MALRDLDEGEKQIIKSLGILAFTMHDIDKLGIHRSRAFLFLHLHLHLHLHLLPLPAHGA